MAARFRGGILPAPKVTKGVASGGWSMNTATSRSNLDAITVEPAPTPVTIAKLRVEIEEVRQENQELRTRLDELEKLVERLT